MDVLNMDDLEILFTKKDVNLPDSSLLLMYKALTKRHIWLDFDISWESVHLIVKYIQYINMLHEENHTEASPIYLHIFSYGGNMDAMFVLYNTIKESKVPIYTINEGSACSAAFIVFLAGKKRIMNEDAMFIAHEGSNQMGGTYRESKAAMKDYEKRIERMKEIIENETKMNKEDIENQFSINADWYIYKPEALELGIVTESL